MLSFRQTYWFIFSLGIIQATAGICFPLYLIQFVGFGVNDAALHAVVALIVTLLIQFFVRKHYFHHPAFYHLYRDMKYGLSRIKFG